MLEFVTKNASKLFRHRPMAAYGWSIEKNVKYLHNQVRMTRNESCHHWSKAGDWSKDGVYFSGYGICFNALYKYQHLLFEEP
jgi:hypothetical protein